MINIYIAYVLLPLTIILMKQKYSHTYAELTKLQNQIRVELNNFRPCGEPIREERKEKYSKKLYHQKYSQTSICELP